MMPDIEEHFGELTSMFDRFLINPGLLSILMVSAGFLAMGLDLLFGPLSLLAKTAMAGSLAFALAWPYLRLLRWVERRANDADPMRTSLIATPEILQRGYERLRSGWLGSFILNLPILAVIVGFVFVDSAEFKPILGEPIDILWAFVVIGLGLALFPMIWQCALSLVAGQFKAAGRQDVG